MVIKPRFLITIGNSFIGKITFVDAFLFWLKSDNSNGQLNVLLRAEAIGWGIRRLL
jgi:hypothetical protein